MIRHTLLLAAVLLSPLSAQTPVVDRAPGAGSPVRLTVARGKGEWADSFKIGASGEIWMIDAVRLWALPNARVQKVSLYGALDNPPVPGVPVCDCHALVEIAKDGLLTTENGLWRFDFHDVRWSLPGNLEALFTLRSTPAEPDWSLAAFPAGPGYRLHLLDGKGVPVGLEPSRSHPISVPIQIWAHRTQ